MCSIWELQPQRVWGSSDVHQTSAGPVVSSPFRLHSPSASGNDSNSCKQSKWPSWPPPPPPPRARTSRGDVLSHDNFVTVGGEKFGGGGGWCHVGRLASLAQQQQDRRPCRLQPPCRLLTGAPVTPGCPRVPISCPPATPPLPTAPWQAFSSAPALTWTHCPTHSAMNA